MTFSLKLMAKVKKTGNISLIIFAAGFIISILITSDLLANDFDQKLVISGKVICKTRNETIPGANIVVKDTNIGTTTNLNGEFTLEIPNAGNSVLVVSFMGYISQEIQVNKDSKIDIFLVEDTKQIDEVVVVGYGTQKKSDLTGSVASVGSEEIQKISVSNAAESLKGRVTGVSISTVDAAPGGYTSIKIRGFNTISGSNEPLIVIDGYTNAGDLNTINPRDIKSIEVLKDASATAIYGARGANGVILITTNSGSENKFKIDFTSALTTKVIANKLEMMNAQQFLVMQNEAVGGGEVPGLEDYETTDWQEEVYRRSLQGNYQLSISGGSKKTNYLISGNYLADNGIIENSDFKRYSVRMKTDSKLLDWLVFSNSIYFMHSTSNGSPHNTMGYGSNPSVSDAALTFYPHLPIKDGNGDYTNMSFKTNPVAIIEGRDDFSSRNYIYDYAELIMTPVKGLNVKLTLGGTYDDGNRSQYWSTIVKNVAGKLGGIANKNYNSSFGWSNENIVTYQNSFKKHNFTATGAFSQEYFTSKTDAINGTGFLNDALTYNNMGGAKNLTASSGVYETSLMSALGRIFYNYNSKYYLTVSGRWDGSSRFAENKKWGFFPAVALAWRMSEESFFKNQSFANNLKFRLSYGRTGNYSALGPYQSMNTWTPSSIYAGIFNDIAQNNLRPSNLGNPDLGWETSTQFDIGLDAGFINDRIILVTDYYLKKTSDLLLEVQLPSVSLLPSRFENIGEVNNNGLEISLNTKNIIKKDFNWSTTLNYSFYRNNVEKLNGQQYILGGPYAGIVQDEPSVIMIGKPLGSFWGYVYEGVFPDNNVYATDKTNYLYLPNASQPEGFIKLKDINNDGKVDDKDRTVIGCSQPDFNFGFINNLTFKNFDLSIYIDGVVGGDVYNLQRYVIDNGNGETNVSTRLLNRWSPENRVTNSVGAGKFIAKGNSLFVEDGSYIKFRDIQIGYNFSESLLRKLYLSDLRIYFSMQNYFTITNYTGYDPEVNMMGGSSMSQNIDLGAYPTSKSITFGLNFGF
jgi:TonB-linked SusC/RagA family outer membrane protein